MVPNHQPAMVHTVVFSAQTLWKLRCPIEEYCCSYLFEKHAAWTIWISGSRSQHFPRTLQQGNLGVSHPLHLKTDGWIMLNTALIPHRSSIAALLGPKCSIHHFQQSNDILLILGCNSIQFHFPFSNVRNMPHREDSFKAQLAQSPAAHLSLQSSHVTPVSSGRHYHTALHSLGNVVSLRFKWVMDPAWPTCGWTMAWLSHVPSPLEFFFLCRPTSAYSSGQTNHSWKWFHNVFLIFKQNHMNLNYDFPQKAISSNKFKLFFAHLHAQLNRGGDTSKQKNKQKTWAMQ